MPEPHPGAQKTAGTAPRDLQSLGGGLMLLGLAGFALWAMNDLDSGALGSLGAGGLPRATAMLLGIVGLVLVVLGFRGTGGRLPSFSARGLLVVLAAIIVFALTIRPMSIGGFTTPGLGLVFSGPLCVFIAGLATNEARWSEMAVLACGLTAFCMVLFGDLLSLPIPVFPVSLIAYFPDGWQHATILRVLAALLAVIALVVHLLSRRTAGPGAAGREGGAS